MFLLCSLPAVGRRGLDDTRATLPRSEDEPMTTDGRQQDDKRGMTTQQKATNDDSW
ncbi:MAG: hypothetical protein WAS73_13750 [Defluviicoccus sp.]